MSGLGTPSIGRPQTKVLVDEKHVDLRAIGSMAEDLAADAIESATVGSYSTFPFNQLPHEIIAEIFWNCLVHEREAVRMSSGNAPLLLCRVCSSWRALVLATPQLWASVGILVRHPNDVDPSICVQITNAWLERSGILPLTVEIRYVKIDYRDRNPTTKPTVLDAVLYTVCSYSSRWQNVAITTWLPLSFPQLQILPLLRFKVFILVQSTTRSVFHSVEAHVSHNYPGPTHLIHLQILKFPGIKFLIYASPPR